MVHFDPEKHLYTLDDGTTLPSVTQILTAMNFIDTKWFDEWSRDKGSLVHLACHIDDTDELDDESLDPEIEPYLSAYRNFKRDSGFLVSSSEVPLASEIYRFAGTPDKFGTFRDATCAVIDIKSGAVAPWVSIQLEMYKILKGSNYRRYSLQLTKDGKYKLKEWTDRQDRQIALSAVACNHWKQNNLKGR
jgi:hypothetical protein